MPLEHGVGVWRVAVMWWHDHQPEPEGQLCRTCLRWWPCPTFLTADGLLDTFWRRATATGRAVVWNPRGRNV